MKEDAGRSDRISSIFRRMGIISVLVLLGFGNRCIAREAPTINGLEAFWEDSVAVVHPTVISPFPEAYEQTLQTGIPIRFDFQIQLFRTGYSKTIHQDVTVEYNVWTDRYRVVAPIGPLAVRNLPTVLKLFRDDMILILHPDDLPREGAWFVRVRIEAFPYSKDEDDAEVGSLERELQGITGWLFRQGKSKTVVSDWSDIAKLSEKASTQERP